MALPAAAQQAPAPAVPTAAPIDQAFLLDRGSMLPEDLRALVKDKATAAGIAEPKAILVHLVDCDSARCEESLKAIEEFIWRELKDQQVLVLGIAVGNTAKQVKELTTRAALTFPVLPDEDRKLYKVFAADGVPRTLVIATDWEIVYTHAGYVPGREAEYRLALEAILNGEPVPAEAGGKGASQVNEDLYAKDIRGQQAPDVPVEAWINPLPADTKGKYKLVDFWATWCGPCRFSLEYSEKIHGRFEDKLVTMAISDEPAQEVEKYVKEAGLKQPICIDTKARAKEALQVQGIPHAILINPSGKVVWQGHPMELWGNECEMLIQALQGKEFIPGKPGTAPPTPTPTP